MARKKSTMDLDPYIPIVGFVIAVGIFSWWSNRGNETRKFEYRGFQVSVYGDDGYASWRVEGPGVRTGRLSAPSMALASTFAEIFIDERLDQGALE